MTIQELRDLSEMFGSFGPLVFIILIGVFFAVKYRKFFTGLNSFIRDWSGTEAEPGRDRVPGVMERLNEIDGALKNNGGSSVKDAVDRIEIRVNEIDDRLALGDAKFDELFKEITKIEKDLY